MFNSYDQIPYMGRVHRFTHVEKLSACAKLFSHPAPSIENCRVLGLGCGNGTNLINMAYQLPNAQFVGIDGSQSHIDTGTEIIRALDLHNIVLQKHDIATLDQSLGMFDYIICHGVFSWVPPLVRKKILQIVHQQLTPDGLAYISYNTLPGWRMGSIIRNMMKYHAQKMNTNEAKISQARAIVNFVNENLQYPDSPYGKYIHSTVDYILKASDDYIFHEYLEEENQAFYFHEFDQQLRDNHLQYFGDCEFATMSTMHYPEKTRETLDMLGHTLQEQEQYMDFLRFRRFRCSVITHANKPINRVVNLDPFTQLFYSFRPPLLTTEETENINSQLPKEEEALAVLQMIIQKDGERFKPATNLSLYRTVILELSRRWPSAVHFTELLEMYGRLVGRPATDEDKFDLAILFQAMFLKGLIGIHQMSPQMTNTLSERPIAAPLARYQAGVQTLVSTQRHFMIALEDDATRMTLQMLDGKHTIEQIREKLIDTFVRDIPMEIFLDGALESMMTNGLIIA